MKLCTFFIIGILCCSAVQAQIPQPVYEWSWTAEGPSTTNLQWSSSFGYSTGNDYATIGNGNKPWKSDITEFDSGNFTLSLDMKHLTVTTNKDQTYKDILALYSGDAGGNGDNNSVRLQFEPNGDLVVRVKNFGGQSVDLGTLRTGLTTTLLGSTEWHNITLVSDLSTQTLTVFLDGEQQGMLSNADGTPFTWNPTSGITKVQFGGGMGNTLTLAGTLDVNNIQLYNTAVLPVPEPVYSLLTLSGLCGLATRRRRLI